MGATVSIVGLQQCFHHLQPSFTARNKSTPAEPARACLLGWFAEEVHGHCLTGTQGAEFVPRPGAR